jgi:hypothetical protein
VYAEENIITGIILFSVAAGLFVAMLMSKMN